MRSAPEPLCIGRAVRVLASARAWALVPALLLGIVAVPTDVAATPASPRAASQVPVAPASAAAAPLPPLDITRVEVALQPMLTDPNLMGTETHRSRRFKDQQRKPSQRAPSRNSWFDDLMLWLSDASRMLMWLGGFAAIGLAAVLLPRWWRQRVDGGLAALPAAPTHVMALDIRPDSLPGDIGAAAAALWQRGEQRAALSLLYRGMLSRLVHVHQVPISSASTEGECAALARPLLVPAANTYVARLIDAWQRGVYAGQLPDGAELLGLCDSFGQHLPDAPVAAR